MPSAKSLFALAAFVAYVSAQATVSTPASLIECEPVLLSWTGGTAPYFVEVLPGGEASATPLVNFGEIDGTSETWTVNLASGTSVTIAVTDSTGAVAYSAAVTIQAGTSDSCLTSSATSAAASTIVTATTTSAEATTTDKATTSAASGSASSSAKTTTTTSAKTSVTTASVDATTSSASKSASSASGSASASGSSSASASSSSSSHTSSGASPVKVASGALGALAMVLFLAF